MHFTGHICIFYFLVKDEAELLFLLDSRHSLEILVGGSWIFAPHNFIVQLFIEILKNTVFTLLYKYTHHYNRKRHPGSYTRHYTGKQCDKHVDEKCEISTIWRRDNIKYGYTWILLYGRTMSMPVSTTLKV